MKFAFKHLFSPSILERGYKYFKEERVSNMLQTGGCISAKVYGRHHYKVSINISTDDLQCNCPYGAPCKHLVAVCHAINKHKKIPSLDDPIEGLKDKNKKELISIIKQMIVKEPELNALLLSKKQQILKKIREIDLEDEDEYREYYDYIPDRIEEILKDIQGLEDSCELLLVFLSEAYKLCKECEEGRWTEDEVYQILGSIEKEKEDLSKKEVQEIDKKIKKVLGEEYEEYTQEWR